MRPPSPTPALVAALAAASLSPAAAHAAVQADLTAGAATVTVTADPFAVTVRQTGGPSLTGVAPVTLRTVDGARIAPATARSVTRDGEAIEVTLDTPDGPVAVRLTAAADGVVRVATDGGAARATAVGLRFTRATGERLLGTGGRSDAVDRSGRLTEHYVADGPVRPEDRAYVKASVPPWAERERDDATYYPVPWVLSTRGWGMSVLEDRTSRLDATSPGTWTFEVDGPVLRAEIVAGPRPADVLRRYTARVGRQPAPSQPASFGPWFQTGQPNVVPTEEERAIARAQRDAGAAVSAMETQMHHLPCGAHEGRKDAERERSASAHAEGLARLVYFNPSLCVTYQKEYAKADAAGALQRVAGASFAFPAFVGGAGPIGFTIEPLAQYDFTHPATARLYGDLIREAVELGADGWMEDFGEGTPPQATFHDGTTGDAAHNRYPVDYHCAVQELSRTLPRPVMRFMRSGWRGAARCADVVWGGDPSTLWGYDGLSSVPTQLLSFGLSGVSRYATDIGGYVSFGGGPGADLKPGGTEAQTLTPELLSRWMELGALLPVMRTKRTGLAIPSYPRPQVFDPERLPTWTRLTALHTQLNRYLRAADEQHRATGLPIARHLVLMHPEEPRAAAAEDQWMLGDDLLAAPVVQPGQTERDVWLPPGRWVSWWPSTTFAPGVRDGAFALTQPTVLTGGRTVRLAAPLGFPPLLVRAGAALPLLDPAVRTLSTYAGDRGLVRAQDRADRVRLIAFPRGSTLSRLGEGASARLLELRRRRGDGRRGSRLVVRLSAPRGPLHFTVEASLRTLRRPFAARRVRVGGRALPRRAWSYDRRSGVLRIASSRLRGTRLRVDVD